MPTPDRQATRRLACLVVTTCLLAGHGVPAANDGAANPTNPTTSLRQAQMEAEAGHARALRQCRAAADYASCVRDADAQLNDTRRNLTGQRQRAATPPGSAAQDAQRVRGERLIRELEQAAPRPRLGRPADPGSATPRP